jgi:hypothetical protein
MYFTGVILLVIKMFKDPRITKSWEEENEMEEEYGRKEETPFPWTETFQTIALGFIPFLNLMFGVGTIVIILNNEIWEQVVDMLLRGF